MGEIFRFSCGNCNYEKKLKLGAGLMSIRADVVEQNLRGEDLEQWQELQRKKNARFFSWQYEMATCNNCKELQSVFLVNVHTNDGEKLRLGGRCATCQTKLDVLSPKDDMTCPICGQDTVSKQLTGRWD